MTTINSEATPPETADKARGNAAILAPPADEGAIRCRVERVPLSTIDYERADCETEEPFILRLRLLADEPKGSPWAKYNGRFPAEVEVGLTDLDEQDAPLLNDFLAAIGAPRSAFWTGEGVVMSDDRREIVRIDNVWLDQAEVFVNVEVREKERPSYPGEYELVPVGFAVDRPIDASDDFADGLSEWGPWGEYLDLQRLWLANAIQATGRAQEDIAQHEREMRPKEIACSRRWSDLRDEHEQGKCVPDRCRFHFDDAEEAAWRNSLEPQTPEGWKQLWKQHVEHEDRAISYRGCLICNVIEDWVAAKGEMCEALVPTLEIFRKSYRRQAPEDRTPEDIAGLQDFERQVERAKEAYREAEQGDVIQHLHARHEARECSLNAACPGCRWVEEAKRQSAIGTVLHDAINRPRTPEELAQSAERDANWKRKEAAHNAGECLPDCDYCRVASIEAEVRRLAERADGEPTPALLRTEDQPVGGKPEEDSGTYFNSVFRVELAPAEELARERAQQFLAGSDGEELSELPAAGWEPVDLSRYLEPGYEPPKPSVGVREDGARMFYAGKVNGLHGTSESGKTWIALHACAQELNAGNRVLYLDYEDGPEGIAVRLRQLGVPVERITDLFTYISPEGCVTHAAQESLKQLVPGVTLAVIDATTEALALEGLSSNDDTDIAAFAERLPRFIARFGPAVVLIDHVPKDRDAARNGQTGSQHKRSAIDGASYLVEPLQPLAPGRSDGRSRIRVSKDRPGGARRVSAPHSKGHDWFGDFAMDASDPQALDAQITEPTSSTSGEPRKDPTLSELCAAICAAVAAADEPMSQRKILEDESVRAVRGGREAKIEAIEQLANDGYLVIKDRGQKKLHSAGKPYTALVVPATGSA